MMCAVMYTDEDVRGRRLPVRGHLLCWEVKRVKYYLLLN